MQTGCGKGCVSKYKENMKRLTGIKCRKKTVTAESPSQPLTVPSQAF